eukprot:superscaffoldBa00001784_g12004
MAKEKEPHWSDILKRRLANSQKDGQSEEEKKAEETELFTKYYTEWRGGGDRDKSYKNIPRFYYRNLWFLLDKHQVPPVSGEEAMISYEAYLQVGEKAGPKCKFTLDQRLIVGNTLVTLTLYPPVLDTGIGKNTQNLVTKFFTARVYAKLLHNDPYGRISIMQFFNYVMRKVWLHQTRIGLSLYDVAGQGYLRESDLENYILELIPTLPQLDGLEKSFYSFYVCTAVRKFFFFLDPLRTGKIKIQDILACSFLDDLLELRDEELSKESQESNWFSAPSALRVYGQYLNLDKDHNGMLSKEELSRYGTATLTSVFLDRVFQECLTYDGEMVRQRTGPGGALTAVVFIQTGDIDYKTYLDFVLALENRKEPAALQYIFKLLDMENLGYLNVFSLNYFFRDEIFDMVKPKDPYKITLQDLVNSCQGDTVTSILIDLNGFWTYENREVLVANDNDGSNTADLDDT